MRRVDLNKVMSETNMAIITDADNAHVYDTNRLFMYRGDKQDKVLLTEFKMNLESSKEDMESTADKVVTLLTELNKAFNRSVGAPESMKLFKVLDRNVRYAGNNTITLTLSMATLATGAGSAIYKLLNWQGMAINIWETEANVFTASSKVANDTYGLGNALRSWKAVMKRLGIDVVPVQMPAVLVNYVQ